MTNPLNIEADIGGLPQLEAKMEQVSRDMTGDPMKAAMGKATLVVLRPARQNAPVDRGILRASITPEVVVRDKVVTGIVGSNKTWALFQELGTRPFWPPWQPLYEWALRKTKGNRARAGALATGARIAISRRGIKAKRYLERALNDSADRIFQILGGAVSRIVRK